MKKLISFSVVAACLLFGTHVAYADKNPNGPYVGGGYGQFHLKLDNLRDVGTAVSDIVDSDNNAWKLFAGYRINPYLGFEAAYIDFGTSKDRFSATGSNGNYRVRVNGFAPYVVGTLPFGPVEVFARLGYYFYNNDVRVDFDAPGPGIDSSHSASTLVYGAGVGVNFVERLNVRLEYEKLDLENATNSNALWLSAAWRF